MTSEARNLRALQAVLLSEVTRLFMATYSTKMRGGYLRFQAQYLRRLRIPEWRDVPEPLRAELIEAATRRDIAACNRATFRLYGLTQEEQSALGGTVKKYLIVQSEGGRQVKRIVDHAPVYHS